jgi:hypothetical protein
MANPPGPAKRLLLDQEGQEGIVKVIVPSPGGEVKGRAISTSYAVPSPHRDAMGGFFYTLIIIERLLQGTLHETIWMLTAKHLPAI